MGAVRSRGRRLTRAVDQRMVQACHIETLESRQLLSTSVNLSALSTIAAHSGVQVYQRQAGLPAAGSSPLAGSLTPQQIRAAYGINSIAIPNLSSANGAGQTIAIIDAYSDPTALADLKAFDAHFGLADPPSFKQLNQNGGTTLPSADPSAKPDTWELEESLDIQWAHAIAPAANIVLIAANSSNLSDLFAAVNTAKSLAGVSVVSMSFGSSGDFSGETAYDSLFTSPTGHGVTFLAASGDAGAPAGYPATSPNVVAVGGTTLSTNSSGAYLGESGWSGSGGSLSTIESQPSYQNGVVTQSSTRRAAPDVAMDADPSTGVAVYDSYDGSANGGNWFQVGGTSLATPMWAGLIALVDQARVANGLTAYDGRTGTLPQLYSLPSTDFHDITSGYNGYSAKAGYDLVTGLGSPNASKLVLDLANVSQTPTPTPTPTPNPTPTPTPTPTTPTLTASPSPATAGQSITLTAGGMDGATEVAFFAESNGFSGLQTGFWGDTLLGIAYQANSSGNWTLSLPQGLSAGNYQFYAAAVDDSGYLSNVVSTTEVVTPAPAPVVGTLAASPSTVTVNQNFTLSLSGVSNATRVSFFQETNRRSGLQIGFGGDHLIGVAYRASTSGDWTLLVNSGRFTGTYTIYAVADNGSTYSNVASTTVKVTSKASAALAKAAKAQTHIAITASQSFSSSDDSFDLRFGQRRYWWL